MMDEHPIEHLAIIAGKGVYPRELAIAARTQGVARIFAIAFKKETDPVIEQMVDEVMWMRVGQLQALLDGLERCGAQHAVMAGQITPTHLFR